MPINRILTADWSAVWSSGTKLRTICAKPNARVPHDARILEMNATLKQLVNESEAQTYHRFPSTQRPSSKNHTRDEREKLIEDRVNSFENRWWSEDAAPVKTSKTSFPRPNNDDFRIRGYSRRRGSHVHFANTL